MSRVFVVKTFDKFARRERISDADLLEAIQGAERGLVDASLRGCLIKLRVARQGQGKSRGYRMIVACHVGRLAFFLFGFAKNEMSNISGSDEVLLDQYGDLLLV